MTEIRGSQTDLAPFDGKGGTSFGWRGLGAGLLASQVVGTAAVFRSHEQVIEKAEALTAAGFVSVPTLEVAQLLGRFPAMASAGLFFTLTLGALLTLATLSGWWLFKRFPFLRIWLWGALAGWTGYLVWPLLHGRASGVWLAFGLLVPAAVLIALETGKGKVCRSVKSAGALAFLLPVLILAGAWGSRYDPGLFVRFRDAVLLRHPVGLAVNRFYYDHTLTAAEVMKPLHHRSVNACRLEGEIPSGLEERLTAALVSIDCLPVAKGRGAAVTVRLHGEELQLEDPSGARHQVSIATFLQAPAAAFNTFSRKNDRFGPMRRVTFAGLLLGLPVLLYLLWFKVFFWVFRLFGGPRLSALAAAGGSLGAGLWLLFMAGTIPGPTETPERIRADLAGESPWERQCAALDGLEQKGLRLSRFGDMETLSRSPHVPVRYRTALLLGRETDEASLERLLNLLSDPHRQVVCMAIKALAERGDQRAIGPILDLLRSRQDGYVQWYAYRSLRRLGWVQSPSRQGSFSGAFLPSS